MTTTQAARPTSRPDPWDRQPKETDPAWEAFRRYRDMGATRSTAKVARELGKSKTLMDGWSAKHSWVIRAAAYDSNVDREHLLTMRDLRRKAAERNATAGALAMQKFAEVVINLDPERIRPDHMAAIARVALQMEESAMRAIAAAPASSAGSGTAGAVDAGTIAGMTDEERRARLRMLVREAGERLADTDAIHDGLHDADDPEED